jgi:hypothetical protein
LVFYEFYGIYPEESNEQEQGIEKIGQKPQAVYLMQDKNAISINFSRCVIETDI